MSFHFECPQSVSLMPWVICAVSQGCCSSPPARASASVPRRSSLERIVSLRDLAHREAERQLGKSLPRGFLGTLTDQKSHLVLVIIFGGSFISLIFTLGVNLLATLG